MYPERETKVKSILITQPPPEPGRNVYEEFAKKYKITIDFRAFIHIEPLTPKEIRKQKRGKWIAILSGIGGVFLTTFIFTL